MAVTQVRPSVFIGSSSEGLRIAQAIQVLLDQVCEVELWSQGAFGLTQGTLESLVLALERFDFAVLVLTADDLAISRGVERSVARDNVLFELGLFVGGLGRERTFMLYDRTRCPDLPSDLAGVTAATFEPHSSGNMQAALGAACTLIQNTIERLGVREAQKVPRLAESPWEVIVRWNEALASGDLAFVKKHTSPSAAEYITQKWGSLEALSKKYQAGLYMHAEARVEEVKTDGERVRISYLTHYPNGSIKRWEDALEFDGGVWKVLPQHVQDWPLTLWAPQ